MNIRFRQELEPEPGREDDLWVYLVALSRRLKRTCRRVLLRFGFWFYALRIIILILISFLSFKVCLDLDQNILSVCLDSRCGDGGSVCWSVSHHAPRLLLRGPAAGSGVLRWIFKVDLWLQEVFQGRLVNLQNLNRIIRILLLHIRTRSMSQLFVFPVCSEASRPISQ